MSGLSGAVLLETLRVFKPGMATVCLTAGTSLANGGSQCLVKPVRAEDLRTRIAAALSGSPMPASGIAVAPEVVARAKAVFAVSASLLDAARELAAGMQGESAIGS
jgi:hypothetical protein